ncbi:MAG: hypothetical protein O4965_24695, partial [Trichodesmium sp. St19_bin1]|nr:hypothetical protein [Trichodesmium sp. St19_bin1]
LYCSLLKSLLGFVPQPNLQEFLYCLLNNSGSLVGCVRHLLKTTVELSNIILFLTQKSARIYVLFIK